MKLWGIIALIFLFPSIANGFDDIDRQLFVAVISAQVFDGMATASSLNEHPDSKIYDIWNWKYGAERPSPARLWGVKAAEIGIAYIVAKQLPSKYRKIFLGGTAILLFSCGVNNGVSFRFRY